MQKYKGYADGGVVEDDEEQDDQPTAAPAAPAPPAAPDYTKALTDYFGKQKSAVDEFGPGQQKATYDHITQAQNSVGNNIGRGAAGFADALMQGVAGAGNPGFLQGIDARQKGQLENAEQEGQNLNAQNLAAIKEKQGMDQMATGNPLGASRASAMIPLLQKIYPTLTPQELQSIVSNPSAAEAALGPSVDLAGKELENKYKGAELGVNKQRAETEAARAAAEAKHQQNEDIDTQQARDTEKRAKDIQAAEDVVKNYHPFQLGGSTREQEEAALKTLAAQNGGQFDHSAIAPGQTYQAPDGTWRKKK